MRSATEATHSESSLPPASEDWRAGGFGVYVHWPFCAAKCPYCDFNSHVRGSIDQERWKAALVAEIRRVAAEVPGRRVDTVFFGGGTPSLMPPDTVAAVIEAVASEWDLARDAEITLEANPTSVDAGRFRGYRSAGVNRISIGVQALADPDLRALGRRHSVIEARAALAVARDLFDRVSCDLIYARQGQTLASWQAELKEALTIAPDHLSLYQLTIEVGTRFGELAARGRLRNLPGEGLAGEMYLATQELCARAGLPAYEISNHARPGAEGRHNLIYWRYGDYAGIGPGAHGRLSIAGKRLATEALRAPEAWLEAAERGGAETSRTSLGSEEQGIEMMMMGLRLSEGIEAARFERLAGQALAEGPIRELIEFGLLQRADGRLRATGRGRAVLDSLLSRLLRE